MRTDGKFKNVRLTSPVDLNCIAENMDSEQQANTSLGMLIM